MSLQSEEDIINLIKEDQWMMDILHSAKSLNLPDWWVCAGFVRSKIWDTLHGYTIRTPLPDIDVVYFDASNTDEQQEKQLEKQLKSINPELPWSVKNEARMHVINGIPPFSSSIDAISKFPETATALGLKLDEQNNVILTAPCGIKDVLQLSVRPTPFFEATQERAIIYETRIKKKNWQHIWPNILIHHINQVHT